MIAAHVSILLQNIKHGFKSLLPILALFAYTLIGAVIFMTIEGPNEIHELELKKQNQEKLLEDTAYRLNTIKSMSPYQAYNHTINTLVKYRNKLGVPQIHLNETKWTIWGAIYFSMTIYTTIGYGNITPQTMTGRVLTIIYAFIGIPSALITLIALGGLFAKFCMYIWKLIACSLGCCSKKLERKMGRFGPEDGMSNTESENDSEELLQFPVGFLIGLTIFWIFFCAYIFLLWEETWDYGLSLYFVLISFTTIGFGDIIPSKSNYMIPVGLMLLIGLSLVSTVLIIIQKQINALADNMRGRIDKNYQAALEQVGENGTDDLYHGSSIEPIDNTESYNQNVSTVKPLNKKQQNKKDLNKVVSGMPLSSRLLYHMMPSDHQKKLSKHVSKRQNIGVKMVQTDAWLMESLYLINDQPNY